MDSSENENPLNIYDTIKKEDANLKTNTQNSVDKKSDVSFEKLAVQLYENKTCSFEEAHALSGISKVRFKKLLKKKNKKKPIPIPTDKELVACIMYLQEGMFDIKAVDIRKLAYQMYSRYNYSINFCARGEVGRNWEKTFFKKYKNIKPSPTNVPYTKEYLNQKMNKYFDTFTNIYKTHDMEANRIFYLEITRVTFQITIFCCANASGSYMDKPMIILKESEADELKKNPELSKTCFITTSPSGKLTQALFAVWLKNFIDTFKVTPDKQAVLFLDENNTKCKYFRSIKLAKDSGVHLIQVPTYRAMHLQPLLMTLIKSMISQFQEDVKIWNYENSAQQIPLETSIDILLKAYKEIDVNQTISQSFKIGGIWPLSRSLFFDSVIDVIDYDELNKTEDMFQNPEVSTNNDDDDDDEDSDENSESVNDASKKANDNLEHKDDSVIFNTTEVETAKNTSASNDISSVRFSRIHCTGCDIHIGSAPSQVANMFEHPKLRTLLCLKCYEFYGDGDFEQGDDQTDMFCRWCANGGNLYCCSDCSNTFCSKCVKRNFDAVIAKKIEDDEKWKCFVCDPTDLYPARSLCRAIIQHVQTVCRILQNDKTMTQVEIDEKMNLDESRCCSRKRKRKRRKTGSGSEDEDDETYNPILSEMPQVKRRRTRKSGQLTNLHTNGSLNNQSDDEGSLITGDNDLLPSMIPCEQTMTEGDTALPFGSPTKAQKPTVITTDKLKTQIITNNSKLNQLPPLNLLKPMKVRRLTPITPIPQNQLRTTLINPLSQAHLRPTIIGPTSQVQIRPNAIRTITQLQPRAMLVQKRANRPMVSIPQPRTPAPGQQNKARVLLPKSRTANASGAPNIIDLESDSDEGVEVIGSSDRVTRNKSAQMNKEDQKVNKNFEQLILNQKHDIDVELQSLRKKFNYVLSDSPTKADQVTNDEASLKMKKFQQVMRKTLYRLAQINDRVVREYHSWKKETTAVDDNAEKTKVDYFQTKNPEISLEMVCVRDSESENESDDDTQNEGTVLETSNLEANQLNCYSNLTLFRKKRMIDQGVGDDPIDKVDKAIQVYDVRTRDFEKSIGYSLLMKAEYDPKTEKEVLKPVEVLNEHFGKFQEQFIFHLQHIEENGIKTTEDLENLPDPNETPLKDLIDANSPFIDEMLENIPPPTVINGSATETEAMETDAAVDKNNCDEEMAVDDVQEKEFPEEVVREKEFPDEVIREKEFCSEEIGEKEASNGEEEEEECRTDSHADSTAATSKAVEELVKMVTKLSDELKSSNNSPENTTLSSVIEKNDANEEINKTKNTTEKVDREKDEETVLAVRTLIEEEDSSDNNFNKSPTETSAIEECNFLN